MTNTETTPKNYTVLASRSLMHSEIAVQFNDRPNIGDKFWYRGTELTVHKVTPNSHEKNCGCWNFTHLGHCIHTV